MGTPAARGAPRYRMNEIPAARITIAEAARYTARMPISSPRTPPTAIDATLAVDIEAWSSDTTRPRVASPAADWTIVWSMACRADDPAHREQDEDHLPHGGDPQQEDDAHADAARASEITVVGAPPARVATSAADRIMATVCASSMPAIQLGSP